MSVNQNKPETSNKPGYKKTKLGWVPEGWKQTYLGEIAKFAKGKGLAKSEIDPNGTLECIRYGELYTIYSETIDEVKSRTSVEPTNLVLSEANDIIIPASGETAIDIATASCVLRSGIALGGDLNIVKTKEDGVFLSYYLNTVKRHDIACIAQGNSVVHLYSGQLYSLKITIPPLPEQKKIAQILSTWDKTIAKIEALLSEKEQLKKGLMQQLLTGKKRFPGFTEEWNMVPLENLCVKKGVVRGPFGGALKKEFFVDSGYKVYEQKNAIYGTTELGSYYIDADKFNEMLRFSVQPEDLIISCSGTIGKIYKIPHKAPEGVINQALLKLTLDTTKVDVEFFLQQFNSERIQYLITESTQGGAMKNLIGMSEFRKTKFYMPEIDEQKRISQTLIRFDIEYSNLRIQRNVLVEQKKGLMQKLLTGEVRVKID